MDKFKNIQEAAQNYRAEPPSTAWDKLDKKLDNDLKKARVQRDRRKFLMLTVLIVGFISSLAGLIVYESLKPTQVWKGQIAEWEELDKSADQSDLYNVDNVRYLDKAMEEAGYKNYLQKLNQSSVQTLKGITAKDS